MVTVVNRYNSIYQNRGAFRKCVEILTEASDINAGKAIFEERCVVCHKSDGGGGIGPNLTDDYWILGGGMENILKTLNEGGRAGKGMISWKNTFDNDQLQQLASYVISLNGTTPANPKEAEGDIIWSKQ